jgi:hypothetical protein
MKCQTQQAYKAAKRKVTFLAKAHIMTIALISPAKI